MLEQRAEARTLKGMAGGAAPRHLQGELAQNSWLPETEEGFCKERDHVICAERK